ncbi:hypothetical protein TWF281_000712 [Arthrobotrys megalospora]
MVEAHCERRRPRTDEEILEEILSEYPYGFPLYHSGYGNFLDGADIESPPPLPNKQSSEKLDGGDVGVAEERSLEGPNLQEEVPVAEPSRYGNGRWSDEMDEINDEMQQKLSITSNNPPPPPPTQPSECRSDPSSTTLLEPALSLLFAEATLRHTMLRIHHMSPLTARIYEERGYKPTCPFIVEDDASLAHIIRVESGWWAWDLKGDFKYFVTGSDEAFTSILMEWGGELA